MFVAALLVAAGALLAFGLISRAQVPLYFLLGATPLLLLATILPASGRFGDLRLHQIGVRFDAMAIAARPPTIGGDPAMDDLVVQGAPRAVVTFAASDRITVRRNSADPAIMVVRIRRDGRDWFPQAVQLRPSDSICVARCDTRGGQWFTLQGDSLRRAGNGPPMREMPQRGVLPLWNPPFLRHLVHWSPEQAIYPLRDYAVAAGPALTGLDDPCARENKLCDAAGRQVRSFLFYRGGRHRDARDLFLMPLDVDARVRRADGSQDVFGSRASAAVRVGDEIIVEEVRYAPAYTDLDHAERPSLLVPRSAYDLSDAAGGGLALSFHPRRAMILARDRIEAAAQVASGATAGIAVLTLTAPGLALRGSEPLNPVALPGIGGALGEGVEGRIFIRPSRRLLNVAILAHPGDAAAGLGTAFTVGARVGPLGERVVDLTMDQFSLPITVVAVALAWGLIFALVLVRLRRFQPRPALLIASVQLLLGVRLLVAIEALSLDPALNVARGIGDPMLAYVAVPLLLALTPPWPKRDRWLLFPAVLMLGVACAAGLTAGLRYDGLAITLAIAASALALYRAMSWEGLDRRSRLGVPGCLRRWLAAAKSKVVWCFRRFATWRVGLIAIVVLRVGLVFFQVKERFPNSIAVTVIEIPLVILCFAGLFAEAHAIPQRRRKLGRAFCLWSVLVLGVVSALVRDNGLVLFAVPIIFYGLVFFAPRNGLGWSLPACAAALLFVGFAFALPAYYHVQVSRQVNAADAAASHDSAAASKLLNALAWRNQELLRIATVFSPRLVEGAGTDQAEQLRRWSLDLAQYGGSALGYGYLAPSNLGDLRAVQANDNVSAVHLLHPYGRLGAAAFVLLLGVLAWVLPRRSPPEAFAPAAIATRLVLWTWLFLAAYMILANLQRVPFTGRNIYFLAAFSDSDLLEGLLLAIIAIAGLRRTEPQ